MHEAILTAKNLTKQYGSFTALDNVDLTVNKGDIFGIIGRNGAGKTTLLKILSGLTECTDGEYSIFSKTGEDLRRQRRRIGCLVEGCPYRGTACRPFQVGIRSPCSVSARRF